MHVCEFTCATALESRPEDTLQELVVSFHHVGPGGHTQVAAADRGCPHLLRCLTSFDFTFSKVRMLLKGNHGQMRSKEQV